MRVFLTDFASEGVLDEGAAGVILTCMAGERVNVIRDLNPLGDGDERVVK